MQENLSRLNQAFSDLVNDFKSDVDNSDSAVLDSEHLSDLSKMIKSVEKINQKTLADLNKEVQMASGAGAAVATFNSVAAKDLNALGKKVTKTNEQLKTFNGKKLSTTLQDIKTVDKNIKDILDAAGGAEKDNKGLAYFKLSQSKIAQKEILDKMKAVTDSKLYKLIKEALSTNTKEAWLRLFDSSELMRFIEKSPNNEKLFFEIGLNIEKYQNIILPEFVIEKFNKIGKYMGYLSDGLGKGFAEFGIDKLSTFGGTFGKILGSSYVSVGLDFGDNFIKDYKKQNKKKHSISRATSDSTIDTVFGNASIVGGTALGAEIGSVFGPEGTVLGGAIGLGASAVVVGAKKLDPNIVKDTKKAAHNLEVGVGKTTKNAWNNTKKFFGSL
ncbi:hypothetical protein [Bombilactobacillus thymidiniphilus]|uniref:LXG domain-containing protein n=1 Tax=Bombilactobacillus thymidiniphilus TaxID=2923363 RepID=A0ABY4PFJ0_9LACO|nr:hypothetical protein [Bombilactobacillus thymidiniphilus]UQS84301.1 hypothetical protein MOO47_03895 [Bombilactobacillus thymidiniphilus]